MYFKITHFSPKQYIPILSFYLISGQILNKKEFDYDTKVQMTHQTLTSLKDKRKCCPLKSLTTKHSGTREHTVNKTMVKGEGKSILNLERERVAKSYL